MKDKLNYWKNQKFKNQEILELLKNIKKEMNIQSPEKVIDKYIKNKEEDLLESIEAYEYYLTGGN